MFSKQNLFYNQNQKLESKAPSTKMKQMQILRQNSRIENKEKSCDVVFSSPHSFFNPIHGNSAENNWSRERGLKWIWEWVEPEL